MERWIWITRWIIFYIRYSKLFSVYFQKDGENIDNLPIRIYVNGIENRITFESKARYYLEPLTHETMKLPGCFENKIAKNKIGKNLLYL